MKASTARTGSTASIVGIVAAMVAGEITDFDRGMVAGVAVLGALLAFWFAIRAARASSTSRPP